MNNHHHPRINIGDRVRIISNCQSRGRIGTVSGIGQRISVLFEEGDTIAFSANSLEVLPNNVNHRRHRNNENRRCNCNNEDVVVDELSTNLLLTSITRVHHSSANRNCTNRNCTNRNCTNRNCTNRNCINRNCINRNCTNHNSVNHSSINRSSINHTSINHSSINHTSCHIPNTTINTTNTSSLSLSSRSTVETHQDDHLTNRNNPWRTMTNPNSHENNNKNSDPPNPRSSSPPTSNSTMTTTNTNEPTTVVTTSTTTSTNEQLLYEMGFTDRILNRTMLQANNNDLDRTVERLIQHMEQQQQSTPDVTDS